jgi:hypothetical protein
MVWHPVLATIEEPPGRFTLLDGEDKPVAEIVLVRRGHECGYRAVLLPRLGQDAAVVGYFMTLLSAVKAAHLRVVSSYAHQGCPIAHWD